ncbi:MAG TPA: hypothetical protein VIR27_17215 [Mycobacteriales bacterium]|jgi:Predicted GTPase
MRDSEGPGALVLVDGEHYPMVVREALRQLPHAVCGVLLVGGTEKLRDLPDYGVPMFTGPLETALAASGAGLVVDLSDEPVLGGPERMALAARALAHGVAYRGADFCFTPPRLDPFDRPSVSLVGTGKRIGKTALCAHTARLLASRWSVVVVSMGRGGPELPELVTGGRGLADLLALSRQGRHAASDHLENAVLAGVPTVGTRRCGGGMAGATFVSNTAAGAQMARGLNPDLVLFEGSGAALPPVATRRRVLVAGTHQSTDRVTGYLGAYRVLVSDLVVLTVTEPSAAHHRLRAAIREVKDVPVIAATMRPHPTEDVSGRRVALFTAAPAHALPAMADHLRDQYGATVVHTSGSLAHRDVLRQELDGLDAEVFLVEIKAAAIDVVAEHAAARGIPVIFTDNRVSALPGEDDLDDALLTLAAQALTA